MAYSTGRMRRRKPLIHMLFILILAATLNLSHAETLTSSTHSLTPIFIGGVENYLRNAYIDNDIRSEFEDLMADHQASGPSFSAPSDPNVLMLQINGTDDAVCTWIFTPLENTTIDDYVIVPVVENEQVIDPKGIDLFIVEDTSRGFPTYNITANIIANQTVGTSLLGLTSLNKTTLVAESVSVSTQLTVVGITFYREEAGVVTIYGGDRILNLKATDLISNNDVNLNVLIQYVDGSNSTTALAIPLDGMSLSTSTLQKQINYSSSCSVTSGNYDRSDVVLPSDCGIGFSTNNVGGSYIGPMFGFDFNPYRNGTFTVFFEYGQILIGSDLEGTGYETFIQVEVVGEVPPLVHSITPVGPFKSIGSEQVAINLGNLPTVLSEANRWTYALSIDFGTEKKEAKFEAGSISLHTNGTLTCTFTLPAGVGTDLPWTLTVTKPTAESLIAVDLTNPPYLFSFVVEVIIGTISPNTGPQAGGTTVTLTGEFPGVESGLAITMDGVALNSSLITAATGSSITFITPAKQDGSAFDVPVVVSIGGVDSNSVIFSYEPEVRIDTMVPESGPVEGGTSVTLSGQFINFDSSSTSSGIYFGTTQINSSSIQSFTSSSIVFKTPVWTDLGVGEFDYVFNVTVKIDGVTSNSATFRYDAPVVIDSITPNTGDEAGGTTHTLKGQFVNFDPSYSAIFIGGKKLNSSSIISFNDTTVLFIAPPRSNIGLAYTHTIWVTINLFKSNEVSFTYLESAPGLTIDGGDGSIDPTTGYYRLGVCSDGLFRVIVSTGTRALVTSYKWTLTEVGATTDLLTSAITTSSNIVLIPYDAFPLQETPYSLTVTVTTELGSYVKSLTLIQLKVQAINIQIIDPRARSLSDPNVTLTIPSMIRLPCRKRADVVINTTAITYKWVFREQTYFFSYLNKSAPEDQITPTLLGREFNIPQSFMEYGSFPLKLTAFYTDQTDISGSDSTTVVIDPAPLIAQINGGEESQLISERQSFALSASQSRDPDVLTGDVAAGLSFSWTCRYGYNSRLSLSDVCNDVLMPSGSANSVDFTLSAANLASFKNATSMVFIEYSLQVSKISQNATGVNLNRISSKATTTLILTEETAQLFEPLAEILVVNNQSVAVDRAAVKYYEDLTLTPVSNTVETTWVITLLTPLTQTRTLLSSDANLLTYPGYYTVKSEAGRFSLGLKANVLTPNSEYRFLISTFRTGYAINEQVVSVTTVEEPRVTVGALVKSSGTTNETYYLAASTSYDGDFKFFFLLSDDFGFETCVGGCQGVNFVDFRLAAEGNYTVRCDVYDYLGFTKLASADGGKIVVTAAGATDGDLTIFAADVDVAFEGGDHSDYQQLGTDMVKYILTKKGSSASDSDSEVLRNFTEGLNQVAQNSVPNAIQSSGFVRTAAALASLTPDLGIVYDTRTLYNLVSITISAVERTPSTAALQQLQDLLDFYDLTPELVLASYSGGTTRTRLIPYATGVEAEVLALWLDLYEVMKEQLAFVALTRCTCGCEREIVTGVSSNQSNLKKRLVVSRQAGNTTDLTDAASYINGNQSKVTRVQMKMAHYCNSEQGLSLSLNSGTDEEVSFSWCKQVYQGGIRKLYFSLAKTPDYIYLSGLHRNVTLSDGLVGTVIGELASNNTIVSAQHIAECYSISMPIPHELSLYAETAPKDQIPAGIHFSPNKQWNDNTSSFLLYQPDFTGMTSTIDKSSSGSVAKIAIQSSRTGTLAIATRYAWQGAGFSLEGVVLWMTILGVVLTLLVLVILASASAWLLATRGFYTPDAASPVDGDFTYLERDVYGRGTALHVVEEEQEGDE